jgi:hypothetical protein
MPPSSDLDIGAAGGGGAAAAGASDGSSTAGFVAPPASPSRDAPAGVPAGTVWRLPQAGQVWRCAATTRRSTQKPTTTPARATPTVLAASSCSTLPRPPIATQATMYTAQPVTPPPRAR